MAEEAERERWELLRSAKNVRRVVGPRGGFRYLSYEYTDREGVAQHHSAGFRDEAGKLLRFFEEHGMPVEQVAEG